MNRYSPLVSLTINYPASDPSVTAAGGSFIDDVHGDEEAWAETPPAANDGMSGGGISTVFAAPSWQTPPVALRAFIGPYEPDDTRCRCARLKWRFLLSRQSDWGGRNKRIRPAVGGNGGANESIAGVGRRTLIGAARSDDLSARRNIRFQRHHHGRFQWRLFGRDRLRPGDGLGLAEHRRVSFRYLMRHRTSPRNLRRRSNGSSDRQRRSTVAASSTVTPLHYQWSILPTVARRGLRSAM